MSKGTRGKSCLSQGTPGRKNLGLAQAQDPLVRTAGHIPEATSCAQRQEQNVKGGSSKVGKGHRNQSRANQAKKTHCHESPVWGAKTAACGAISPDQWFLTAGGRGAGRESAP